MNSMRKALKTFVDDENGAVTVDFVVLTASILLLGLVVVTSFSGEVVRISEDISTVVSNQ